MGKYYKVDSDGYYQGQRQEMYQFIPKQYSRVLEIGCGEGNFIASLPLQSEKWGIEPVSEIAESAKIKLDKVLIGTYEELYHSIPDHYFDLVICNDVIEHMVDHDYFFKTIANKMTPEAALVASIPNVRYFDNLYSLVFKKNWQYMDSGILDRTHLRFFTEKSLKQTLENYQFKTNLFLGINPRTERIRAPFKNMLYKAWTKMQPDIRYMQFAFSASPQDFKEKVRAS